MSTEKTSDIKVFTTEESTWSAMIEDINNAKDTIVFEQFIFLSYEAGEVGANFIDAFIAASKRGVSVAIHLDGLGSYKLLFNKALRTKIKDAGIELLFYRTIPLRRLVSPTRVFIRNHRKVLLVDRSISWLGGAIMGEEFRSWFDYTWRISSESFGHELQSELDKQYDRLETGKRILAPFAKVSDGLRLVGNSPGVGNRHVYEQICEHILLAKNEAALVSPYFIPPTRLFRVLEEKLKEGLRIKLFIPRKTDHQLADWARWSFLRDLFNLDIEIYCFDSMNHAKIVVADNWATFGSTNLDYLSLIFNHELNVDTQQDDLIKLVRNQITDWQGSRYKKISSVDLRDMKPNWIKRLIGFLLRPIT